MSMSAPARMCCWLTWCNIRLVQRVSDFHDFSDSIKKN